MAMTPLYKSIWPLYIYIHGIQTRSIQNDTLENRIVAFEKLVENLEDRIKNGTNSSKEGLFVCLMEFIVLLVEENGEPEENHRPVASHWQTLSWPRRLLLKEGTWVVKTNLLLWFTCSKNGLHYLAFQPFYLWLLLKCIAFLN